MVGFVSLSGFTLGVVGWGSGVRRSGRGPFAYGCGGGGLGVNVGSWRDGRCRRDAEVGVGFVRMTGFAFGVLGMGWGGSRLGGCGGG